MRYIPVCRSSVSRSGVEISSFLFKGQERRQPARVKEIQRQAQLSQICQAQFPSVPQRRSRFQRTIISRVIESRQLRRVVRALRRDKIGSPSVLAMPENERPVVPRFDRDLPDAAQSLRQPISERAFLRESAHFKARAIR